MMLNKRRGQRPHSLVLGQSRHRVGRRSTKRTHASALLILAPATVAVLALAALAVLQQRDTYVHSSDAAVLAHAAGKARKTAGLAPSHRWERDIASAVPPRPQEQRSRRRRHRRRSSSSIVVEPTRLAQQRLPKLDTSDSATPTHHWSLPAQATGQDAGVSTLGSHALGRVLRAKPWLAWHWETFDGAPDPSIPATFWSGTAPGSGSQRCQGRRRGCARIVVSLSSSPTRLPRIRTALESLLRQSLAPDLVLLVLPVVFRRTGQGYELPGWLATLQAAQPALRVVRTATDFGPATKLLGALLVVPDTVAAERTMIVTVDDDRFYTDQVVATYVKYAEAEEEEEDAGSMLTSRLSAFGMAGGYLVPAPAPAPAPAAPDAVPQFFAEGEPGSAVPWHQPGSDYPLLQQCQRPGSAATLSGNLRRGKRRAASTTTTWWSPCVADVAILEGYCGVLYRRGHFDARVFEGLVRPVLPSSTDAPGDEEGDGATAAGTGMGTAPTKTQTQTQTQTRPVEWSCFLGDDLWISHHLYANRVKRRVVFEQGFEWATVCKPWAMSYGNGPDSLLRGGRTGRGGGGGGGRGRGGAAAGRGRGRQTQQKQPRRGQGSNVANYVHCLKHLGVPHGHVVSALYPPCSARAGSTTSRTTPADSVARSMSPAMCCDDALGVIRGLNGTVTDQTCESK